MAYLGTGSWFCCGSAYGSCGAASGGSCGNCESKSTTTTKGGGLKWGT